MAYGGRLASRNGLTKVAAKGLGALFLTKSYRDMDDLCNFIYGGMIFENEDGLVLIV